MCFIPAVTIKREHTLAPSLSTKWLRLDRTFGDCLLKPNLKAGPVRHPWKYLKPIWASCFYVLLFSALKGKFKCNFCYHNLFSCLSLIATGEGKVCFHFCLHQAHMKSVLLFSMLNSPRDLRPFASHMLQSLNHLHGCSLTLLWCVLASHSGGLRPQACATRTDRRITTSLDLVVMLLGTKP